MSKLKILTESMRAAAGFSARAQAVLAIIIAESWPHDAGFAATLTHDALAERLNCSTDSITRAIEELANLIEYQPGRRHYASTFVLRSAPVQSQVRKSEPSGPHPCAIGPQPEALRSAPVRTPHQDTENTSSSTGTHASTDARAAAAAAFITKRPDWLHQDKPWIDAGTAIEIWKLPHISLDHWNNCLKLTKQRRLTLTNPAGFMISILRKAPAPALFEGATR